MKRLDRPPLLLRQEVLLRRLLLLQREVLLRRLPAQIQTIQVRGLRVLHQVLLTVGDSVTMESTKLFQIKLFGQFLKFFTVDMSLFFNK